MSKKNNYQNGMRPSSDGSPVDSAEAARLRREQKVADILPTDTDHLGKIYDSKLVGRLTEFTSPYNRKILLAMAFMGVSSLGQVVGPWAIGKAIDDGIRVGDVTTLRFWTVIFLVAAIVSWLTNRQRLDIMAIVGTRIVADVRHALFSHLHRLSLTFYNEYSVGRLMSRLISDVGVLQDFVTWSITGVARAVFVLGGIAIAMLLLNWQLTLVTFIVMPFLWAVASYWRRHAREAYIRSRAILSHINGYLNESISGIRVTKSFAREKENGDHFDDLNLGHFESMMRAEWLSAFFFPSIEFFGYLATALVVMVGGRLVIDDSLTAGVLVTFVLYIARFFDPVRELARRLNTFQATMAATERIFRLLDTEPDIVDSAEAHNLTNVRGEVVFDDVHFAYNADDPVLRGISLTAKPGERIAFVGETGAGKSTIIRLLSRFFEVTEGAITIDGHNIREVTRASLRQQLGIVLQETFLFSGTIMDNIRYGRLEATDEEVIAAATAVGADTFITRWAEGYHRDVGENGVNLSVGQRQILSFARALLADPQVLILDEATSSVDTATEKIIQTALDHLMAGRTSFVIAHRLSTIINSDKIVVLDQGKIVEVGTHEVLLSQKGRYYNLYTMQWAAEGE